MARSPHQFCGIYPATRYIFRFGMAAVSGDRDGLNLHPVCMAQKLMGVHIAAFPCQCAHPYSGSRIRLIQSILEVSTYYISTITATTLTSLLFSSCSDDSYKYLIPISTTCTSLKFDKSQQLCQDGKHTAQK